MKRLLLTSLGAARLAAQGFNAGSNGSLGDVVLAASTNIALPPDGVLNYRSLQIASGVTVTFTVPLSIVTSVSLDTLDLDSFLVPVAAQQNELRTRAIESHKEYTPSDDQ
jgi:hypothetical protein